MITGSNRRTGSYCCIASSESVGSGLSDAGFNNIKNYTPKYIGSPSRQRKNDNIIKSEPKRMNEILTNAQLEETANEMKKILPKNMSKTIMDEMINNIKSNFNKKFKDIESKINSILFEKYYSISNLSPSSKERVYGLFEKKLDKTMDRFYNEMFSELERIMDVLPNFLLEDMVAVEVPFLKENDFFIKMRRGLPSFKKESNDLNETKIDDSNKPGSSRMLNKQKKNEHKNVTLANVKELDNVDDELDVSLVSSHFSRLNHAAIDRPKHYKSKKSSSKVLMNNIIKNDDVDDDLTKFFYSSAKVDNNNNNYKTPLTLNINTSNNPKKISIPKPSGGNVVIADTGAEQAVISTNALKGVTLRKNFKKSWRIQESELLDHDKFRKNVEEFEKNKIESS